MSDPARRPALGPPPERRRRRRTPSRRVVLGLAVVAAIVAVPFLKRVDLGDGARVDEPPARPVSPTAAERSWLTRYAGWVAWVESALRAPSIRLLLRCDDELDSRAGSPPSDRVAEFVAIGTDVCDRLVRGHRDTVQATVNEDAELLERGIEETREGERLLALVKRSLPELADVEPPSALVPVLTLVARRFSAGPAQVWCWSADAWPEVSTALDAELGGPPGTAGVAAYSEQRIDLDPEICGPLRSLRQGGPATWERASAVGVFGHEIAHLRGRDDEARAECEGMQLIRPIAVALGASPGEASRLARLYWSEIYPANEPIYVTPSCRDRGPLDLRPQSGRWP